MKKLIAFICLLFGLQAQAATFSIEGLRLWAAPDHTRLVFDTSGPVDHTIFGLDNPDRLVIDIKDAGLATALPEATADDLFVKGLRSAARNGNDLRVVLDLKQGIKPKSFVLKPNSKYGHRLVVDLYGAGDVVESKPKVVKSVADEGLRDIVIAIDAGHGGEDVGAVGPRGTYEKDVVIAVARKLKALIEKEPGMHAVLTREGDYFIPLRKRMEIARSHKADLFVSIHADAFKDQRVQGASVYTLSNRGASSEAARWLAESENASDLVGGVTLDDKDEVLASVLLDLSQNATRQVSMEVADEVYGELRRFGKVHGKKVQQAGFMVLKSPDVPSLLVETAFISNPTEEKRLRDTAHQQRLAEALMKGVRSYFQQMPPPGTYLAVRKPRQHVISRGETLSVIAQQYRVSLASLRDVNGIAGDRIRVGQVLQIPGS